MCRSLWRPPQRCWTRARSSGADSHAAGPVLDAGVVAWRGVWAGFEAGCGEGRRFVFLLDFVDLDPMRAVGGTGGMRGPGMVPWGVAFYQGVLFMNTDCYGEETMHGRSSGGRGDGAWRQEVAGRGSGCGVANGGGGCG